MGTKRLSYHARGFSSLPWWVILFPFIIFIAHSLVFKEWIIDDAGISMAYARNLATGHGLVSQPGNPPVEGFSDFLWVLLLSPFFLFSHFSPLLTPKIISFLLIFITFFIFYKVWAILPDLNVVSLLIGLSLLSLNTSFVVWTTSGLENALYLLLISYLFYLTVKGLTEFHFYKNRIFVIGIVTGGIALTRPDGIVYFVFFPIIFLLSYNFKGRKNIVFTSMLTYFLSFLIIYGSYIAFRLIYFNDIFPNTYYAKGGPNIIDTLSILTFQPPVLAKYSELINSVAGIIGNLATLSIFFLIYSLVKDNLLDLKYICFLIILYISLLNYLLLPPDWMGEYRFATPFIAFFYLTCFILLNLSLNNKHKKHFYGYLACIALISSCIIITCTDFYKRSLDFSKKNLVNFITIQTLALKFNNFVDFFKIENPSLLTPDIGGHLYSSKLKIFDLGGLCDRTIANTFNKITGKDNFYNYIFKEIKPTIILTHSIWARLTQFDNDPRFRRDYFPLQEQIETFSVNDQKECVLSGIYLRKDAVANGSSAISTFQNFFKSR
jgi:hypothetical protein